MLLLWPGLAVPQCYGCALPRALRGCPRGPGGAYGRSLRGQRRFASAGLALAHGAGELRRPGDDGAAADRVAGRRAALGDRPGEQHGDLGLAAVRGRLGPILGGRGGHLRPGDTFLRAACDACELSLLRVAPLPTAECLWHVLVPPQRRWEAGKITELLSGAGSLCRLIKLLISRLARHQAVLETPGIATATSSWTPCHGMDVTANCEAPRINWKIWISSLTPSAQTPSHWQEKEVSLVSLAFKLESSNSKLGGRRLCLSSAFSSGVWSSCSHLNC